MSTEALQEPDWKAEYMKSVESGCITLDELREALAELGATNRQVEILSDALAEARREVAALKAVQEPIGYLFQHEETGLTTVVDVQQVEWGFEKNNPRHQKIGPVYTTPPAQEIVCSTGLCHYKPAAAVQSLPSGVSGGLVAIKTLLSRDPCVHANIAIEMIDAILKEHPAAQPAPVQEPVAIDGNTSDGYHTFNELYEFRKAYNAALFNEWAAGGKCSVHKSWRHHDGELCFGGGWFIVVAVLPDGQISNHYEAKDWDLFAVPETERALFEFDGHTGADVVERLKTYTTPPAQPAPAQEPVAWMKEGWGPDCGPYIEFYRDDEMGWRDRKEWTPLYTTPPAQPAPDLQAELEATNRQVEILSDALADSRREVAALKAVQPVAMRMPKVGDRVVCIDDESLGTVVYLTAGGSPEIKFDDGSHGTYMLREFAELFGYTTPPAQEFICSTGLCHYKAQRQWVGLSQDELDAMFSNTIKGKKLVKWVARAIEAKLREKNTRPQLDSHQSPTSLLAKK
jgi:hypothetical protein